MANFNSFNRIGPVPTQIISGANAALSVPATGLVGYPSPVLASGAGLYLPVPDSNSVDGKAFRIRLVGRVTTGTTSTFTPSVYLGTSSTVASDTTLGAGTASAGLAAGTYGFNLVIDAQWDSVTGKIAGYYTQVVNGALASVTAITVVAAATASLLNFIPVFAFGSSNAANAVTVTDFAVEIA